MRIIICFTITLLMLSACESFGDKVVIEKKTVYKTITNEVYYKGDVSRRQADILAVTLERAGYFDTIWSRSVQMLKQEDTLRLKFVIPATMRDSSYWQDRLMLLAYNAIQALNTNDPVVAYVTDSHFRIYQRVPLRVEQIGNTDLLLGADIEAASAKSILQFLIKNKFLTKLDPVTMYADKRGERVILKVISKEGMEQDVQAVGEIKYLMTSLSEKELNNTPVDFYFVNRQLETKRLIRFEEAAE